MLFRKPFEKEKVKMKFLTVFVFAFICMAVFIGQSQVEANNRGSNNIVLKDGHLILSTSSRRRRGGTFFKIFNILDNYLIVFY